MQGKKRTGALAAAITTTVLLLHSAPSATANADMVSEFSKTCVAAKSQESLKSALGIAGWKAFATLSQSHLEREIAAVTPMLEAQGLASDYTIYGWDGGSRHLELALSVTRNPIKDGRKLVGCSMYDFAAKTSIDSAIVSAFAPTITGQKSTLVDVQIEKWDAAFGDGSEMRAVFRPPCFADEGSIRFCGYDARHPFSGRGAVKTQKERPYGRRRITATECPLSQKGSLLQRPTHPSDLNDLPVDVSGDWHGSVSAK